MSHVAFSSATASLCRSVLVALALASAAHAQTTVTHDPAGNRAAQAAAVAGPPTILAQPSARLAKLGDTVRFTVVAGGPGPFTYQWLAGASLITGATADTLVLTNVQAAQLTPNPAGNPKYSVRVSNASGNVTSTAVALYKDTGGRGLPDWWQMQYFGALGVDPNADPDADGRTNLQEYLDGTDPNDGSSHNFRLTLAALPLLALPVPPGLVKVSPDASSFAPGANVTLTAASVGELEFAGWSVNGTSMGAANPLTFAMDGDKSVTAVFGSMPLDAADPMLSFQSEVADIAVALDGSAIVGFTSPSTPPVVARVRRDGTLDPGFNSAVLSGAVSCLAIQPDGKVLVAGGFTLDPAGSTVNLARLNADGSLDFSFPQISGTSIYALALQPDGRVLVAGANFLWRLNSNGTNDASFAPVFDDRVIAVARQPDGHIVTFGFFNAVNGANRRLFARLLPDGTLDTSFQAPFEGNDIFIAGDERGKLIVQPDGSIIFGGPIQYALPDGQGQGLLRLLPNGAPNNEFTRGYRSANSQGIRAIAQQDDHFVVGSYGPLNYSFYSLVARLRADGQPELSAFAGGYSSYFVNAIASQSDGSLLLGGQFPSIINAAIDRSRPYFARFVTTNRLLPGDLGASPSGPLFAAGASVGLSLSPQSLDSAITSVELERSSDGVHFQRVGSASGSASTWAYSAPLPPGVSYYRALVTDALQRQRRSFAAGPFTTPPAVTSALSAAGTVGIPFAYAGTATGPLTSFSATGLPAWATGSYDANLGTYGLTGTPNVAGLFTVTLRPVNAAGMTPTTLSILVANRFSAWQNANFTPAELGNPAISGPLADSTGSGIPNLLRYALGIPAHRAGTAGLPTVSAPSYSGTRYLTLTYRRDKTAADVALTVQVSANLAQGGVGAGWVSGTSFTTEVSRTDNGDGTETVVTRDNTPMSGTTHRFIRLQATQQ